ncbi:MAG TPA: adenosylcobinamide-GDP ribazoletransferase, partial [Streptosporangiaceae bacterium]
QARWLGSAALLLAIGVAGWAAGAVMLAIRGVAAVACGLLVAAAVRWLACRRFGGMTGDVYGALIELGAATVLLVAALSS